PFKVYGHDQTRSFCYIDDAVEGTVLAMEQPNTNGEIYHIGSMDEITIETLIKEAGKIMGYEGVYENAPTYPGSVSRRCPDITKARKQLGYEPKVKWQDGLKITMDWYKEYLQAGKSVYE
ncbi:MAG: GDP-mannose 4,6-dehydratase, partial [Bacteroidetes bacterium]|nr:GDP-mannose 4,6-dehydratase [Bacteroidota bacterium]